MIVLLYLIVINLLSYFLMWDDKSRAKAGARRIPERILFEVALVGGSIGGTVGMFRFRHKTKHWYFRYGFPALIALHLALAVIFLFF